MGIAIFAPAGLLLAGSTGIAHTQVGRARDVLRAVRAGPGPDSAAQALVDESGKSQFDGRLAGATADWAIVGKLEQLRDTLPADQRKPIDQALAALKEWLQSYPRTRAALHAWLAAHAAH